MASTIWRGHLTFGLISIPVRLFRAARAERIALKRVAKVRTNGSEANEESGIDVSPSTAGEGRKLTLTVGGRTIEKTELPLRVAPPAAYEQLMAVRQSDVLKNGGLTMPESVITRAVEVEKNRFVEVPVDELKNLKAETSSEMAIQEFVALTEIDPLYFETSYYVVPDEVGEKAYALLYRSLVKTNVVAIAELAMHGRDHVVVVRPGATGLVAHTMFYASEVHLDEQFRADRVEVSNKELELAGLLIGSLTAPFEAEKYKNGYQQKLQALIDGKVNSASGETRAIGTKSADVIDIADALRRSLAELKKPVQQSTVSESQSRPPSRVKKASRSGG